MAEFPALPLWTDAYLADTTHLSGMQHGVFLLLLITAWRSKNCRLPDDDVLLAKYARVSLTQWRRLRPVIAPFWKIENGHWFNSRLTDELAVVKRMRDQRVTAGRASALKRLNRGSTFVDPPLNEHIAPTPTPTLTGIEEIKISSIPDEAEGDDFEKFWAASPRKVRRPATRAAYDAALLVTTADVLLTAMKRYAASRRGEPERFTAGPATWLEEQRWLDGISRPPGQMTDAAWIAEQEQLRKLGVI